MSQLLPIQSYPNHALTGPVVPGMHGSMPPGYPETEDGFSLGSLAGMARRHWILISVIVALSLGAAYLITRMTRPVYRASATLYFAARESTIPALDILNQIQNGNSEVATEMEVMRSRALAETVVDVLGLQATVTEPRGVSTSNFLQVTRSDPAAPEASFQFSRSGASTFLVTNLASGASIGTATVGTPFTFGNLTVVLREATHSVPVFVVDVQPRGRAIAAFVQNMKVSRPNATASVVQVSYTSQDPLRARDVPDVLAKTYLAWRSSLRKSGDRSTVEFLKEQIDTIATQLYTAEEALRRFRQENQVVDLPTQATSQVQRLANLEAQQGDVDMQRAALRNLLREVKSAPEDPRLGSPYRRLMAFPSLMTPANPALSLLQTLTTLEKSRSELLVRRTPADPEVIALTQSINGVETQIAAVVDTYLRGLDEQATSLAAQIGQFRGRAEQVPRKEVEYARLSRAETGLTQIYTMLQTRLREAQIAEAVDDGSVRVVDPAAVPTVPIAPRPAVNALLGVFFGILLAFGAVMVRERLDHTVHTKEEVETLTGAPILALIPHIGDADRARYFERSLRITRASIGRTNGHKNNGTQNGSRLLLKDAQSVAAEAFRKLRTNITFARPDSPPRVLIFTSPAPGDGKSTSVMNLAIALVQQGKRVIVLDADMRRGALHKLLNGVQTPGLSEILVGQTDFDTAVQVLSLESFGTVAMLSTGVVPPNPAELLASPRFRALIETLRQAYDAILIDSPPINLVTDAAIIGRETDGAIVVARASKTTRGELAHAIGQLKQVQVPITGMVLNDYDAKRDAGYNAPYYYGYSYEPRPYSPS